MREWPHERDVDVLPEDKRPTARLDLEAWRKRVARMMASSGGLRSSGLFNAVKVKVNG